MTTIYDEIMADDQIVWRDDFGAEAALRALGIDPDLPAEWATVDRCLGWLDERGYVASSGPGPFYGSEVTVGADFQAPRSYIESTLHAALIAACKAVQEATDG